MLPVVMTVLWNNITSSIILLASFLLECQYRFLHHEELLKCGPANLNQHFLSLVSTIGLSIKWPSDWFTSLFCTALFKESPYPIYSAFHFLPIVTCEDFFVWPICTFFSVKRDLPSSTLSLCLQNLVEYFTFPTHASCKVDQKCCSQDVKCKWCSALPHDYLSDSTCFKPQ